MEGKFTTITINDQFLSGFHFQYVISGGIVYDRDYGLFGSVVL